jgi:hypothetical protein
VFAPPARRDRAPLLMAALVSLSWGALVGAVLVAALIMGECR